MQTYKQQKGFTLVELAIVMTIIGLLIGGILKGQELMENARVTATISQVKAYEAATTTFRDSYAAIPGDMPNAVNRLPNCNANCDPAVADAGNSIVGEVDWSETAGTNWAAQFTDVMAQPPADEDEETQLFWTHLLLADLIAGVTDAPISSGDTPSWGITHPAGRIGGGFIVGFAEGSITIGSQAASGPSGMVIALVNSPLDGADNATTGLGVLTPARAGQIDRKVDDGRPGSGYVQSYGPAATCHGTGGTAGQYLESSTTKDCGLVFRIQG